MPELVLFGDAKVLSSFPSVSDELKTQNKIENILHNSILRKKLFKKELFLVKISTNLEHETASAHEKTFPSTLGVFQQHRLLLLISALLL